MLVRGIKTLDPILRAVSSRLATKRLIVREDKLSSAAACAIDRSSGASGVQVVAESANLIPLTR